MSYEADIENEAHMDIFEAYVRGIGMTPRMITAVETGVNYRSGEEAAAALGVTRQNVNNCINGRQKTVKGLHLVRAADFRRTMVRQLDDICRKNGTDVRDVMEAYKMLGT